MENKPPPDDNGKPQPGALAALDRSKQYLVAVAGILTVATQIWSIIEAQWRLAAVTVVLASIVVALYVVSHRIATQDQAKAAALRRAAIGFLIATPLVSILALVWYSYVPRYLESGTTIVVARFVGPKLPSPYQECRPSDMLVRTLARVGERFGGLTAYELPYSVDPENRFAELWAEFHGTVDAADVIVYGEYTLHSSSSEGTEEPDEIVINPEVARVPTIPLQFKSPPLYVWDFPSNVVKIQQLCGGDLEEAAAIPRFLDDGRRIADAIVGLQELGHEDFVSANAALEKARNADPTIKRSTSSKCARQSLCTDSPGVLAFYLGTLDEALGHYVDAKQAYAAAARIIGTSTPFVNLGEIDAVLGDRHDPSDAFKMFDHAVELDPNSVGAIATRSAYERDYLQSDRAAIDLERAMEMPAQNLYDILALSRAIYQRNQIGDAACAIQMLGKVIDHPYFPP
ncbi:MAG TPA: hypothetical protein VK755_09590, partial [Candidatus Acidoferrales bacterium]|nr:hypothetical protein [Candidatus Acidoferrales bacterium]